MKRWIALILLLALGCAPALAAGVTYMPDVTAEMSDPSFWPERLEDAREVILTPEEIEAFNRDTASRPGTMVQDLRDGYETFDGLKRNEAIRASATDDANYYLGWTYGGDGREAEDGAEAEPAPEPPCPFADVAQDDPARIAITWAAQTGLVRGASGDRFAPEGTVSGQKAATALEALANLRGIRLEGDAPERGSAPLAREELAAILYRYGPRIEALTAAVERSREDGAAGHRPPDGR